MLGAAAEDGRLPEPVRLSVHALRRADVEFGRWGARRPFNLEEDLWPVFHRDNEVVRMWDLFEASPNEAAAMAVAAAVDGARRERLRLVG